MRRELPLIRVFIATLVICWPAYAQAQCGDQGLPKPADKPPLIRLVELEGLGCLGGIADTGPVATSVREALAIKSADADSFRAAVALMLERTADYVNSLKNTANTEVLTHVAQQVELTATMLGTGQSPAVPAAWALVLDFRIAALSLSLQASLEKACAPLVGQSEHPTTCGPQFELTREILRIARLTKSALDYYVSPVMRVHHTAMKKRAAQWDAYFTQARSQYPWELGLNGAVMKDARPEVDGVKLGFRDVPSDQILFLHPYAAFEYASEEPEGSRFSGIALVDLIGYNRWRWKSDGSMGTAFGISAIIAMGDHANMDDIGWGGMLHVDHKWSVGMTFMGGKKAVLVSGDVAQLFTKVSALRKKKLMSGE